jgi:hypothetical protein
MNIKHHCDTVHNETLVGGFTIGVVVGVAGIWLLTGISTALNIIAITAKIIIADVTPNAICTLFEGLLVAEFPILGFFFMFKK